MATPDGSPLVLWVVLPVGALVARGLLMIPLWRRGLSLVTATFAAIGATLALGGGSSLVRLVGGDDAPETVGRVAGLAVAVAGSYAVVLGGRARTPRSPAASRDPGWPIQVLLPGRGPRSVATNPLTIPRVINMASLLAPVVLGAVVVSLASSSDRPRPSTETMIALTAAVGVTAAVSFAVDHRLGSRIVAADEASLSTSYRGTLVVRIVVAAATPLLAFAGAVVSGFWWLYPFALLVKTPVWLGLAPSARNIARIDERRGHAGNPGSLYEQPVEPPVGDR